MIFFLKDIQTCDEFRGIHCNVFADMICPENPWDPVRIPGGVTVTLEPFASMPHPHCCDRPPSMRAPELTDAELQGML